MSAEQICPPKLTLTDPTLDDITADLAYQAFVESMVPHCRCSRDCPCDGVLAGGLCDDIQEDERETIFDCEDAL